MFDLPLGQEFTPNILSVGIQPDGGIHFQFQAKVPETAQEMRPVDMAFHYRPFFGIERLLVRKSVIGEQGIRQPLLRYLLTWFPRSLIPQSDGYGGCQSAEETGMMPSSSFSPGTITLIGSGEMSASMSKVHSAVMSRIAGPVRAVFLDTPAGFELNADQISAKAVQYFEKRFDVNLAVASFKAAAVTPAEIEDALGKLQRANYIFAGPGSPTYAIRNWSNTPILEAMAQRLASGAHLVFASAAAIAMGCHALPVYEIYKVGEEPHWVEGLNLLGPYGLELAIVTHWNNAEGGTYDTRYCFMGEPRLRILEESLPDSASILGIDEHTACIVDLSKRECLVIGVGQVNIRRRGREVTHAAGTVFELDQLKGVIPAEEAEEILAGFDWPDVVEDEAASAAPFVELLGEVRAQLRAAKQWALADQIRQRLSELGIILEDGPTETTWRRADAGDDGT